MGPEQVKRFEPDTFLMKTADSWLIFDFSLLLIESFYATAKNSRFSFLLKKQP